MFSTYFAERQIRFSFEIWVEDSLSNQPTNNQTNAQTGRQTASDEHIIAVVSNETSDNIIPPCKEIEVSTLFIPFTCRRKRKVKQSQWSFFFLARPKIFNLTFLLVISNYLFGVKHFYISFFLDAKYSTTFLSSSFYSSCTGIIVHAKLHHPAHLQTAPSQGYSEEGASLRVGNTSLQSIDQFSHLIEWFNVPQNVVH